MRSSISIDITLIESIQYYSIGILIGYSLGWVLISGILNLVSGDSDFLMKLLLSSIMFLGGSALVCFCIEFKLYKSIVISENVASAIQELFPYLTIDSKTEILDVCLMRDGRLFILSTEGLTCIIPIDPSHSAWLEAYSHLKIAGLLESNKSIYEALLKGSLDPAQIAEYINEKLKQKPTNV